MRPSRTLGLLVSVSVMWSELLCGLSGRTSANQAPIAGHASVAATPGAHGHHHGHPGDSDDGCAGDCDGPGGRACPHAQVCCQTWALALRVSLAAPSFLVAPQFLALPLTTPSFVANEWRHRRSGFIYESPPPTSFLPPLHGTRASPRLA